MKPLDFLNAFKNEVLIGTDGARRMPNLIESGTIAGGGLLGLHALNSMRRSEAPPEVINQQIAAANYGNSPTAQSANSAVLVDDGSGNMVPVEVPALNEQDIENQKRYLSRSIATNLLTIRQLEAMQQQIAGNVQ
jgi:hypothetical protein